jgi:hypothetical protein
MFGSQPSYFVLRRCIGKKRRRLFGVETFHIRNNTMRIIGDGPPACVFNPVCEWGCRAAVFINAKKS